MIGSGRDDALDETRGRLASQLIGWLAAEPDVARVDLIDRVRSTEPLMGGAEIVHAVDRALERARGLGGIAELFSDAAVTEIMINGPGSVWVDRGGELESTHIRLERQEIDVLVERVLDPLGLRVDRTSPIVDARLPDGSRVNVVVAPVALHGPVLTIRRFRPEPVLMSAFGPSECTSVLADLVRSRSTVLVVGGTGSGKTTLLNALGCVIPPAERIVVIEDTAELQLPGDHVVRLEARRANAEGVGAVDMRDLVRTALRMRPDRLVVGEVRGGESLDLLMALNTGHEGSMATCHANDPEAGLRRLEMLALLGGIDVPLIAIRHQIFQAIDAVVHVARRSTGRRVVTSIASVDELGVLHDEWSQA